VVNVQSIGAAIQNMLLASQDLGIGSLWICDDEECQMIAAVSLATWTKIRKPEIAGRWKKL